MSDKPRALPYVLHDQPSAKVRSEPDAAAPSEQLDIPIEALELSIRTANCMLNADILYIGELVRMTEEDLLRTKNFGRRSLKELAELLGEIGLRFGMDVGNWVPPEE